MYYYDDMMKYCWIITKMMLKCCWSIVKMMPKCCENGAEMLLKFCQNGTEIMLKFVKMMFKSKLTLKISFIFFPKTNLICWNIVNMGKITNTDIT
jgi:hypothetical protein